jgi:hypothetical protein
MKRRDLLKFGGSAVAMTAMLTPAAKAAQELPFAWSSAAAEAMVGQSFWLNHPQRNALALVLNAVRPVTGAQAGIDQFSLQFSSSETGIAAATYDLEHPAIGHFALYLAPAAADAGNTFYRADFNLLA